MMFRKILAAAAFAALALTLAAGDVAAQNQTFPIPSAVCQGSARPLVSSGSSGKYDKATCATSLTGLTAVSAGTVAGTTSVTVGTSGTALTQIKTYSQTLTPVSVAANGCATQTFTVTGIAATDYLILNGTPITPARVNVRPSGADTIAVTYCNPGNGALTPVGFTATIIAISS